MRRLRGEEKRSVDGALWTGGRGRKKRLDARVVQKESRAERITLSKRESMTLNVGAEEEKQKNAPVIRLKKKRKK